jgi:hypothetical protein
MDADEARRKLPGTIGWGLILWLIGYAVALGLYAFVPVSAIGWLVSIPLIPFTILIAYRRLRELDASLPYCLFVAASWLAIAVILDYIFIVRLFKVEGYYDLDVTIYYILTFLIPLIIGWRYGKTDTTRREVAA